MLDHEVFISRENTHKHVLSVDKGFQEAKMYHYYVPHFTHEKYYRPGDLFIVYITLFF